MQKRGVPSLKECCAKTLAFKKEKSGPIPRGPRRGGDLLGMPLATFFLSMLFIAVLRRSTKILLAAGTEKGALLHRETQCCKAFYYALNRIEFDLKVLNRFMLQYTIRQHTLIRLAMSG